MSMRICLVTSMAAGSEPRAPKHAMAFSRAFPDAKVTFIDCAAAGQTASEPEILRRHPRISRKTAFVHHRKSSGFLRFLSYAKTAAARFLFRLTGWLSPAAFGPAALALAAVVRRENADIFVGHNIETLLLVARAAKRNRARLVFDSMEFYSDMGEGQTTLDRRLAQAVETAIYPDCDLILAASDELADALVSRYKIKRPLVLYNTPPVVEKLPPRVAGKFRLYWRNTVIGFGQRGLEDALAALARLPEEITLHVQGRLPAANGDLLRERAHKLGVWERLRIHPPYAPEEAVIEAAPYMVGLCLERKGCRNHDLTVSNKIFDYMMAGLAVVSSDLPGLRSVLERSGGGLLYTAGDPVDLARQILCLYEDRALAGQLAARGRAHALSQANSDATLNALVGQIRMLG